MYVLLSIALALVSFVDVDGQTIKYHEPHCATGRETIVHLFEWKWTDIKRECETFLGPYGYCGVQISPPNENAIVTTPNRPWWERYQPVSYKLVTRSGNEQQFRDMVEACNKNNVRIYVDLIMNHMTGSVVGTGTAGSRYDGANCDYPGVPYSAFDCNGHESCSTGDLSIHNFDDPNEVRNCRLYNLADLKLTDDYVRGEIIGYMNKLISMGVAGFRIDAVKHIWPQDLDYIFQRLTSLNTTYFPPRSQPFMFQEMAETGAGVLKLSEYFRTGRVTSFVYGEQLSDVFLHKTIPASKLQTFGQSWNMPNSNDVIVFLSNHDNQRGHGTGGDVITFFNPKALKIATAFMLAYPYGFPRIMSSYTWNRNISNDIGPPHNPDMSTKDVTVKSDISCDGDWVCEHRWRQLYNMVAFRNVVANATVANWWSSGDFQIAFSRGSRGFLVITAAGSDLSASLNTGLPQGSYCDVISGNYENGRCTGNTINVGANGHAQFTINGSSDDPVIALHIGAKVGAPKRVVP